VRLQRDRVVSLQSFTTAGHDTSSIVAFRMSRASSYFPFCALYCHIISRSDTFFEGEEDVIAVFDFDYATMEEFDVKVGWAWMLFPAVLVLGTLCLQPCYMRKRVQWEVYSQHLCVTRGKHSITSLYGARLKVEMRQLNSA
jgi:hypothetical protein